jgi:dTDP-glucose 4,6-dehydratase
VGKTDCNVVNVDKLTYAAVPQGLAALQNHPRYRFVQSDVVDRPAVARILQAEQPEAIVHFAAETHVDRSIDDPEVFVATNVVGTSSMLIEARRYFSRRRDPGRFVHVSTDEIFGSLGSGQYFTEGSAFAPNSPYAATKAAADLLVRAWQQTFDFPAVTAICSNAYGPWQFPEKFIPVSIIRGLSGLPIDVYGTGANVREWTYVDDIADGIVTLLERGQIGESYLIGSGETRRNLDMAKVLCSLLDRFAPRPSGKHEDSIRLVADRPGHDARYASDSSKIRTALGWAPTTSLDLGLEETVRFYVERSAWWREILANRYRGERLGRGTPSADLQAPRSGRL